MKRWRVGWWPRFIRLPLFGHFHATAASERRASDLHVSPVQASLSPLSKLGDLGVPPHVIDEITNHKSGAKNGVTGIYNHSPYEKQKIAALNKWAKR
jgi:hypothetical protein